MHNFSWIKYIIPRDPEKLKSEVDALRATPVGTSNASNQTSHEKQFSLLSTQIAKKYGCAWKVQVTNTYDPIFDDIRKSDILWEFHNGKEKGHGTQGSLFKLERIILTPLQPYWPHHFRHDCMEHGLSDWVCFCPLI